MAFRLREAGRRQTHRRPEEPAITLQQQRIHVASGSSYEPEIGFCRALRVGDRVLVSGTAPVWPDGFSALLQPPWTCWLSRCGLPVIGSTPA